LARENFGGVGTARKLMEKTLAVDKTHSLFSLDLTTFWRIKLWRIGNEPPNLPKFSSAKVLCYTVNSLCIHMYVMLITFAITYGEIF